MRDKALFIHRLASVFLSVSIVYMVYIGLGYTTGIVQKLVGLGMFTGSCYAIFLSNAMLDRSRQ